MGSYDQVIGGGMDFYVAHQRIPGDVVFHPEPVFAGIQAGKESHFCSQKQEVGIDGVFDDVDLSFSL